MAIEKKTLTELLNGEGELDQKIDELMALYQEDFDSQLNAIKATKEAIKAEKTEEIAKRHATEQERDALKEANAKLEKQIKDLAPEEMQRGFEQRLQDAANHYQTQISELEITVNDYKTKLSEAERAAVKVECLQEFNKAISNKKIASDSIEAFSEYVLGVDCSKFDRRPVGDGKTVLATKDGLSVKQAVESACLTSFGKNCLLNTSFGGGAEGGASGAGTKNNPFITNNITEQMRLYRENRAEYDRLKSAAGK